MTGAEFMEIIVCDDQIVALNAGTAENQSGGIIYKDKDGLHEIDFETCAHNYRQEEGEQESKCVAERNVTENYYLFYTSGIRTKIVFQKALVFRCYTKRRLYGSRKKRFLQLQQFIFQETKYTTFDLT